MSPRGREGCAGLGVVPQFPHCTAEQGAVPTRGHQGAVGTQMRGFPHVQGPRCAGFQMCPVPAQVLRPPLTPAWSLALGTFG